MPTETTSPQDTPVVAPSTTSVTSTTVAGRWEGEIALPGTALEIVVVFEDQDGQLSGQIRIPAQLAASLPAGAVRLSTPVAAVAPGSVRTAAGSTISAAQVVVATEGPAAADLLGLSPPRSRPVACVWFAADVAPFGRPLIALDGERSGPALNVAVMTNVAPEYSSDGRAVIAAACPALGADGVVPADLLHDVRSQLRTWFGSGVDRWEHLRTHVIAHGQPDSSPRFSPKRRVSLGEGLFVCGDHRDTPSIQGALFSGRRCAEELLAIS